MSSRNPVLPWIAVSLALFCQAPTPRVCADEPSPAPRTSSLPRVIDELRIGGRAEDSVADLEFELTIRLDEAGPLLVSIGLDGLVLGAVSEEGLDLAATAAPGGGWAVRLAGIGEHRVLVRARAPLVARADGWTLDLPIPPASSTRLDLQAAGPLRGATLDGEPTLQLVAGPDGIARRIVGRFGPRSRLLVRALGEPTAAATRPVLSTDAQVLIEVAGALVTTRTTLQVRVERGELERLEFAFDPDEQILSATLDGQPVAWDPPAAEPDAGRRSLPQNEPWKAGEFRTLTIATSRPLTGEGPWSLVSRGVSIPEATLQTGVIAVLPAVDRLVRAEPEAGLVRIDPRMLPFVLRSLPSLADAFRYSGPEHRLTLQIEPAPSRVTVDARTAVEFDASTSIAVVMEADFEVVGPAVPEVRIDLPEHLRLARVGPDSTVAFSRILPPAPGSGDHRTLAVELTSDARNAGRFRLTLEGRLDPDAGEVPDLGLFRPHASSLTGQIAVVAAPNQAVTLAVPNPYRPLTDAPPRGWAWPGDQPPSADRSVIWVEDAGQPEPLRVRVHQRPPQLLVRTVADLTADADQLRFVQDAECRLPSGSLDQLTVLVPAGLDPTLEIQAFDRWTPERLGPGPDATIRYRLTATESTTEPFRLRFQGTLALNPHAAESDRRVTVPLVQLEAPGSTSEVVRLHDSAGLKLAPLGPGWRLVRAEREPGREGVLATVEALELRRQDGSRQTLVVEWQPRQPVAVPATLAECLWIRSLPTSDGALWVSAQFWIETDRPDLEIALPSGASWRLIQVDGLSIPEVERLGSDGRFRVPLPAVTTPRIRRVDLEYQLAGTGLSDAWVPPRLLDAAVVRRTYWEVGLPWDQSLIGTPAGWLDENHWRWGRSGWRRTPRLQVSDLARALDPSSESPQGVGRFEGGEPWAGQTYLFSVAGPVPALRPRLASRATIVAACSGATLGLGLLLLFADRRVRQTCLAALAAGGVAFAWFWPELCAIGGPASLFGLALVGVAWLTKRLVERRRGAPDSSARTRLTPNASQSTVDAPPPDGAGTVSPEPSTVIRPRQTSTAHSSTAPVSTITLATSGPGSEPVLLEAGSTHRRDPDPGRPHD